MSAPASEPILHADNLSVGYAEGPNILEGLDFDAYPGEVKTLIGPNGCGKSTLLKSLSKLLTPRSGEVYAAGHNLHDLRPKQAATHVAVLPQHPSAPPGLTVGELVERGRHPYRRHFSSLSADDYQIIDKAMEETNVLDLAERDIASLSGGQRQRVWLAMTLAQDTPILLLDEPTTFLDPANAIMILQLVRRQAQAGKAVVVVLHDLMLAGQYSDTMVVLKEGEVIAEGVPAEALTPEVLDRAYGLRADVWEDPDEGGPVIVPRGVSAQLRADEESRG